MDHLIPYSEQFFIKDLICMDLLSSKGCLLFELCVPFVLDLLYAMLLIEWDGNMEWFGLDPLTCMNFWVLFTCLFVI